MKRATSFRAIRSSTNDMLDYLETHPYASVDEVQRATRYTRQQVLSVLYQYGFTDSARAKEKFPRLCEIGDKIRSKWKAQDLVDKAQAAEAADKSIKRSLKAPWSPKLKKGPLPPPEQAKEIGQYVENLEKKQAEPTHGQVVLRETIAQDDSELTKLRKEVARLRIIVQYLQGQRDGHAI